MPVFVITSVLLGLVGQLTAYRVLLVWVYDRTGSLPVVILMHASLSACTFILGPSATGAALLAYGFVQAAAWWVIVAAVLWMQTLPRQEKPSLAIQG